jgi:hypothetical protein
MIGYFNYSTPLAESHHQLYTYGTCMRQRFNELNASLTTFQNFVLCQHRIAQNVAALFLFNRRVSDFYAACCINKLSRDSISWYETLTTFAVDCNLSC